MRLALIECPRRVYRRDELALRDALQRMHQYAPMLIDADSPPHLELSPEPFEAALRARQKTSDVDHDFKA